MGVNPNDFNGYRTAGTDTVARGAANRVTNWRPAALPEGPEECNNRRPVITIPTVALILYLAVLTTYSKQYIEQRVSTCFRSVISARICLDGTKRTGPASVC